MFRFVIIGMIVAGMVLPAGAQQISSATRSELAPMGRLRVGINFGNTLLAAKDANGAPGGIAVELAQELARRVGVPLEIVSYDAAGKMADGAKAGAWDVAFLATDPGRASEIAFTSGYIEVDTTYLVSNNSSIHTVTDVDRPGVRIAVSDKSAYDLFLSRSLKQAQLVRAPNVNASIDVFFADKLDAVAGLRPVLADVAAKRPGVRILDGGFTVVQQAVGTPAGRSAAATYLRAFVTDVTTSGFVSKIVAKNNIRGVTVLPKK